MISSSLCTRKRHLAMPAPKSDRTSWRALPVLTGDVRPDAADRCAAGVDANVAFVTRSGPLTWSPPI